MNHAGRTAFVTGASSGIGRAVTIGLAALGYKVTAVARRQEKLKELRAETRNLSGSVSTFVADVTVEEQLVAAVNFHRRAFGRMDILINGAGYGGGGVGVGNQGSALIDRHFATNMRAAMITCREAIEFLKVAGAEHGKALVVNIASIAAKRGPADMSAYASTKAGLRAFGDSLRTELRDCGVQVVTLMPSMTATEMSSWVESAGLPLRCLIQPSDVVAAVKFLLEVSPNAHIPEIELSCPAADRFMREKRSPWKEKESLNAK